jgi:pyrroloquinoline quinone biosynthesis protein D
VSAGAAGARAICAQSRPRLPAGVRLRFDAQREAWVILAPERVLVPEPIAVEILQRCDGGASVESIARELAQRFDAELGQVRSDIVELLEELSEKGFLES